jgi:hypothetical protein
MAGNATITDADDTARVDLAPGALTGSGLAD